MNKTGGSVEGIAEGGTKEMSLVDFLEALICIQDKRTPKIQIN